MRPVTATQRARMADTTSATFEGTATRRRFPMIRDRYNNLVRDTANPVDLADIDVVVWHEASGEDRDDRDRQTEKWLARVPLGTDITGRDLLIVGAHQYEVIGAPLDARTHLRLELELVEG